jgi:signal peptidase I
VWVRVSDPGESAPDDSAASEARDSGRAVRSDIGSDAAADQGATADQAAQNAEGSEPAGHPGAAASSAEKETADGDASGSTPAADTDGPPVQRKGKRRSFWRELPILIVIALLLAVIIKTFAIQAFWIPSGSMENTLEINDRILVNKIVYHTRPIHRGDIVVFNGDGSWDPGTVPTSGNVFQQFFDGFASMFGFGQPGDILIKRVIGLPGDHVACCDAQGRVTVNGVPLNEQSYLYPGSAPSLIRFNIVVPPGRLWVMGDNRYLSDDSRDHQNDPGGGTIPESAVIGRAFVIIWPPSRWRFLPIPATFQQPALNTSSAAPSLPADPSNLLSARLEPAGPAVPLTLGFAAAVPVTWLQRRVRMRITGRRRPDPKARPPGP